MYDEAVVIIMYLSRIIQMNDLTAISSHSLLYDKQINI